MIPAILFTALIAVESGGNDRAIGDDGKAFGCLQITESVLKDVERLTGKRYTQRDCFQRPVAIRIAKTYLAHYCTQQRLRREPTLQDYARTWVGGPAGPWKDSSRPYWEKVSKQLSTYGLSNPPQEPALLPLPSAH